MPALVVVVDCKGNGSPPNNYFSGVITMPDRSRNTGIRILAVDAIFSSLDTDLKQVWVNEVVRLQLITGAQKDFVFQADPRLVCEAMDLLANQGDFHNYVFRRPGIYPQNIFRDEPFTGAEMSIVLKLLRADPISDWVVGVGFKILYDVVSVSSGDEIRLSV